MTNQVELDALHEAILKMHGTDSEHVESVPVTERFQGEVVWDGVVEVFKLASHEAPKAYAWSHESDSGGRRFVAVLHSPPVDSPLKAVQAALVQEYRQRHGGG
jgi:hypothetical protein